MSDENRKDIRRQNLQQGKYFKKPQISEEQKFLSKSKNQRKKQRDEIIEEELWEDWEQDYK
jgi:hypothetical protein